MLLALAMTAALFAGCSATAPAEQAPKPGTAEAAPPVAPPVTLKLWAPLDAKISATMKSMAEVEAVKVIQQETNVTLDIQHPLATDTNGQMQLSPFNRCRGFARYVQFTIMPLCRAA